MTKEVKRDTNESLKWQKKLKAVIYKIAFNSNTKESLQDYKKSYDELVGTEGVCQDDGKDMKDYLDSNQKTQRMGKDQQQNSLYLEVDEDDKIPSNNLSIDHHPHRTCEYIITYAESKEVSSTTELNEHDSKWIIDDTCISDLCFKLKTTTSQIAKHTNPAQVSDICILILNDIYIFDKNSVFSVTKYFPDRCHSYHPETNLVLCDKYSYKRPQLL